MLATVMEHLQMNISGLPIAGACSGSNVSIFIARLVAELCSSKPPKDVYSCEKALGVTVALLKCRKY
eukprot:6259199-Heterocapsa_arctica.AAC.1